MRHSNKMHKEYIIYKILKLCFVLLFVGIIFPIYADTIPERNDEQTKSLKYKNLNEVIIKADLRKEIPGGIAYFPTKKEKKFAYDAYTLLKEMAIPELLIVPGSNKIETITNANVTYFIDGIRASDEDLKGLNPKDVNKIEFLMSPFDAKFAGAENVVNFVMKKYVTGGYTKSVVDQNFNSSKGIYSLNSKITHKNFTYDAYVEGGYTNDNRKGVEENQQLKNISYNGEKYKSVDVSSKDIYGKSRDRLMNTLLKTTLIKEKFNFYVTAGLRWNSSPLYEKKTSTIYSPIIIESNYYKNNSNKKSVNPYIQSSANFDLGKSQNINIYLSAQCAKFNAESSYYSDQIFHIFNKSHDTKENFFAELSYSKRLNRKNSIYLETWSAWESGEVGYQGSSSSSTSSSTSNIAIMARYSHIFTQGTNISAKIGYEQQWHKIDDYRSSPAYIRYELRLSKRWNKKSYLRVSSQMNNVGYPSSMKNDIIIRNSELFWKKGNVNLRNRIIWDNSISNVWNLSNTFSITGAANIQTWFNRDIYVWDYIEGYDGLVTYLSDNNKTHRVIIRSTSTLRLFDRKFVISANVKYRYFKTKGEYSLDYGNVSGNCAATWYGKNWYVGGSIVMPDKELDNITRIYTPLSIDFKAGFNLGEFNISAYFHNPFKTNHIASKSWINTPNYTRSQISFNGYTSQSFRIVASYTIGYGKKVDRDDPMIGGGLQSGAMEF